MNEYQLQLSFSHFRYLTRFKQIPVELVYERGYKTVYSSTDLEYYGFPTIENRIPGLLIPSKSPFGITESNIYIPNTALKGVKNNFLPDRLRPMFFAQPYCMQNQIVVDCPIFSTGALINIAKPLFITFEIELADFLASLGACSVAILGLENATHQDIFLHLDKFSDLFDYERVTRIVHRFSAAPNPLDSARTSKLVNYLKGWKLPLSNLFLPQNLRGTKWGIIENHGDYKYIPDLANEFLIDYPMPLDIKFLPWLYNVK
jgi:hypothetical protein